MKIVVIGGTGLVGSKVVAGLEDRGHELLAAAPNTGVNTLTGEGLAEALAGAEAVIDVSNSPSFEDEAVMEFFATSTGNVLAEAARAGVGRYVALSIVGADRLPDSGYLRAKVAQEKLIAAGSIPYTIVRATQFFEFVERIADEATDGDVVRLPHVLFRPIAADDIAAIVCDACESTPVNGIVEAGGPEQFWFDEFIAEALAGIDDPRSVAADPDAPYFGTALRRESLVPERPDRVGETSYSDWRARAA